MHTIQSVAEKTGLTPDVIRIWERRYNVVSPERTASNQRLYTDQDIERLNLLRQVTEQGRRISIIAGLSTDELRTIARATTPPTPIRPHSDAELNTQTALNNAIAATISLDPIQLERTLQHALISLGSVAFMMEFAAPLMDQVGNLWRSGNVRTCQEHFASAHMRSFLGRFILDANTDPNGPRIVIATLPGQLHELGATMSAVVAAQSGWNAVYLGASVPVEEILFSADCMAAKAIGISLGYPHDDPSIPLMLEQLHQGLPKHCTLLAGGNSAPQYRSLLTQLGVQELADLRSLATTLDRIR